ncbi:MAG: HYExAFE family protein [Gemmataceae bacterium]
MDRTNHYELAFESYLQARRLAYVAVDETRRALLDDVPVKSLDFLVFGRDGSRLVIDVKGRRFPGGPADQPRRVWECWSVRDDVDGLDRWAMLAGADYRGLLVFAYLLHPSVELAPTTPDLHVYRGRRYLFRAVDIVEYRDRMRERSRRWGTVDLPISEFRAIVRPFDDFVRREAAEEVPF